MLTPYVLEASRQVLSFLITEMPKAAASQGVALLVPWLAERFRSARALSPSPFRAEQLARVHDVASSALADLGLPEGKVRLVADAIVGSLSLTHR